MPGTYVNDARKSVSNLPAIPVVLQHSPEEEIAVHLIRQPRAHDGILIHPAPIPVTDEVAVRDTRPRFDVVRRLIDQLRRQPSPPPAIRIIANSRSPLPLLYVTVAESLRVHCPPTIEEEPVRPEPLTGKDLIGNGIRYIGLEGPTPRRLCRERIEGLPERRSTITASARRTVENPPAG